MENIKLSEKQIRDRINEIQEIIEKTSNKTNFRIIGIKNNKNKLEDELIELQTKLLSILDKNSEYNDLIQTLKGTKKQLLNSKGHNKFSLITEIIDLIPLSGYYSFISTPATITDIISQHKMKNKIFKIYELTEKDNRIDLKLKHINTSIESNFSLIIETIETSLEFIGFIKKLILMLSILKIGLTGYNTYLLGKIGEELEEIHNYIENKLTNGTE